MPIPPVSKLRLPEFPHQPSIPLVTPLPLLPSPQAATIQVVTTQATTQLPLPQSHLPLSLDEGKAKFTDTSALRHEDGSIVIEKAIAEETVPAEVLPSRILPIRVSFRKVVDQSIFKRDVLSEFSVRGGPKKEKKESLHGTRLGGRESWLTELKEKREEIGDGVE